MQSPLDSAEIPSPRQLSAAISLYGRLRALMATPEFEAKHPRDEDGQFTETDGGGGGGGRITLHKLMGMEMGEARHKLSVEDEAGNAVSDPMILEIAKSKAGPQHTWNDSTTVDVTAADIEKWKDARAEEEREGRERDREREAAARAERTADGIMAAEPHQYMMPRFRSQFGALVHRLAFQKNADGLLKSNDQIAKEMIESYGDDKQILAARPKMFTRQFRADYRGKLTPDVIRAKLVHDALEDLRGDFGGQGHVLAKARATAKAEAEATRGLPPRPPKDAPMHEVAAWMRARNEALAEHGLGPLAPSAS